MNGIYDAVKKLLEPKKKLPHYTILCLNCCEHMEQTRGHEWHCKCGLVIVIRVVGV